MSPAAVLIVRRLADPLPGQIMSHRRTVRVDAAWERAARNVLAEIYRRAARPSQGYVLANAKAVLFADEGEMLACLALDMVRGEALARWWWHAVLRNLPSLSSAGLTTLLCERAASVPAALHHLAARGQAVRVVEALSPGQALAVLAAMGRAYGIPDLGVGAVHPSRPAAEGAPDVTGSSSETKEPGDVAGVRRRDSASVTQATAPWAPGLVPPSLRKERACLLGVGLSLYHRPAVVRGSAFRRALADWWAEPAADQPAPLTAQNKLGTVGEAGEVPTSTLQPARKEEDGSGGQAPHQEDGLVTAESRDAGHRDRAVPGITQGTGTTAKPEETLEPASESDRRPVRPAVETVREQVGELGEQEQTDGRLSSAADLDREIQIATPKATGPDLEGGVHTQLGGVLYLINLMAHLDLPACFEEEWALDSQVGAWGVLELLGRGLLAGDWEPSFRENNPLDKDLLWTTLAQLDGREPGELPGAAFRGGDRFRLPVDWVTQVGAGEGDTYAWATRRWRLRLWSKHGYVLLDGPRDGSSPKAQAAEELRRCLGSDAPPRLSRAAFDGAPVPDLTGALVTGLNPHLARWLALVLPYIRFRLRRTLSPDTAEAWDLGKALLLHPGRLYVTSTHVDLVMSLDSISLPVRLAGLDCNPGWMPDFARVVLFHFE
jgi:hypothetical protein